MKLLSALKKRRADPHDVIYRHGRIVRVTHWLNALAIFALLITGFGITQLHKPLYWGDAGQDWGEVGRKINGPDRNPRPILVNVPEFPSETGLSPRIDAAVASAKAYLQTPMRVRDHIMFAWLFLFNGLVYLIAGFVSGRFRTLLRPNWRELSWRRIGHDLWEHARLRFPKGEEARSYNLIQKYTYLFMIFVVLPLQLLSGLALLPWFDAAFPWLKDLFLGRQSARTIHFSGSLLILGFIAVHLAMVVLSGFGHNMRSMITGWYRIPR